MTEDNSKQDITQRIQLKPDKKKTVKQNKLLAVLRVLIGISLVAVVVFGVVLLKSNHEYAAGNGVYDELRTVQRLSNLNGQENNAVQNPASNTTTNELTSGDPGGQPVQISAGQNESLSDSGTAAHAVASSMNFEPLKGINDDIVAWIFAEGRSLDLPVVKGTDNDYYLNHLFDHQYNKLGTLFVDYQNKDDFSDRNTIIYGHNMSDGSMFSVLESYKDQTFYDSFPEMDLYTTSGDYTIELFAGVITSGDYKFIRINFEDDIDFLSYVISMRLMSTFESPVEVGPNDRIVTLSTCVYDFDNARYVLFGKLVPTE